MDLLLFVVLACNIFLFCFCFKAGTFVFPTFNHWQIFKKYDQMNSLLSKTKYLLFTDHVHPSGYYTIYNSINCLYVCNSQYLVLIYSFHLFWSKKALISLVLLYQRIESDISSRRVCMYCIVSHIILHISNNFGSCIFNLCFPYCRQKQFLITNYLWSSSFPKRSCRLKFCKFCGFSLN